MKILIVGQAKTGTTGLHYRLRNSLDGVVQELFERTACPPQLDPGADHVVAKTLIGGAAPVDLDSFDAFDRKIAIIRDPRDRHISALLYRLGYHSDYFMAPDKTARMADLLREKESGRRPVSVREIEELDRELQQAAGPAAAPPTTAAPAPPDAVTLFQSLTGFHFVRYEDFVQDDLAGLAAYLGFELSGSGQVDRKHSRVVRTKQAGSWRQWFTPADVSHYRPAMDPFLQAFGYDTAWDLPTVQHIEPEHCSAYYERLIEAKSEEQRAAVARIMGHRGAQPA